jgi:hypothetical protein
MQDRKLKIEKIYQHAFEVQKEALELVSIVQDLENLDDAQIQALYESILEDNSEEVTDEQDALAFIAALVYEYGRPLSVHFTSMKVLELQGLNISKDFERRIITVSLP